MSLLVARSLIRPSRLLGALSIFILSATACNANEVESSASPQPSSTIGWTYTPSVFPTATPGFSSSPALPPTSTPCSPKPIASPPTVTASHIPKYNVPPLTYAMLLNGTYNTSMSGKKTFKDGIYQDEGGYISIRGFAFGDLSNDGVDDAVMILAESFTGGSMGGISFFAVINENGVPVQTNIIIMGDRTPIHKMNIQQGRLVVTGELGPWYEGEQFHTPVVMTYKLSGLDLYRTRFYSMDSDGWKREIRIASPADGTAVTCSVQVRGAITIAPPDNKLVYAISDQAGKIFSEGSIPVTSDGAGGPGTFNGSIPLINVPAGIDIQLDIAQKDDRHDYKITLAMDSVDLKSE